MRKLYLKRAVRDAGMVQLYRISPLLLLSQENQLRQGYSLLLTHNPKLDPQPDKPMGVHKMVLYFSLESPCSLRVPELAKECYH